LEVEKGYSVRDATDDHIIAKEAGMLNLGFRGVPPEDRKPTDVPTGQMWIQNQMVSVQTADGFVQVGEKKLSRYKVVDGQHRVLAARRIAAVFGWKERIPIMIINRDCPREIVQEFGFVVNSEQLNARDSSCLDKLIFLSRREQSLVEDRQSRLAQEVVTLQARVAGKKKGILRKDRTPEWEAAQEDLIKAIKAAKRQMKVKKAPKKYLQRSLARCWGLDISPGSRGLNWIDAMILFASKIKYVPFDTNDDGMSRLSSLQSVDVKVPTD
jgi:hypothetical protein